MIGNGGPQRSIAPKRTWKEEEQQDQGGNSRERFVL
jgi:hypothetical protein